MGIRFEFLRAFNGDCILISTENSNILIDGGTKKTYNIFLKREIERLRDNGKRVDLVVSTHIDSDHIDGIFLQIRAIQDIKLLENLLMIWINLLSMIITYL
jgi:flavorubredoxin